MVILGGSGHFWGPVVGAAALTLLNQQITSYTQYWPLVLGVVLIVLLFAFPARHPRQPARRMDAPEAAPPCLRSAGLRKSFGGFEAIADVSLTVERRQIVAIIGPNGAGKSTFFNLITGHLRPDAGRVVLNGRDLAGLAPHRLCAMGMGRSFQRTNIFPQLTVFENVQSALLAHGGRGRDFWTPAADLYRAEAEALLADVGLLDKADAEGQIALARQPEAARAGDRAVRASPSSCSSTSRPPACRPTRPAPASPCCSGSPPSAA